MDTLADQLRLRLDPAQHGEALHVGGDRLYASAEIADLYLTREFRPIWVEPGGGISAAGERLLAAIDDAEVHGLAPERYHSAAIEAFLDSSRPVQLAGLELLLTDAFIAQVVHRSAGVLNPVSIDDSWLIDRSEVDPVARLRRVLDGEDPYQLLERLWPQDPSYGVLLAERRRLLAETSPERAPIAAGRTMRVDVADERTQALRERLGVDGSGSMFDADLAAAVRAFQRAAGLEPDGVVGPMTLAALNRSRGERLDSIAANMERLRWLPRMKPEEFIQVNIADFELIYEADGERLITMDVIVGRAYRQTPIFRENMRYLVLNPFWDLPRSIAVRDKLPLFQQDAAAQAALGYEAAPLQTPGQMVSVTEIDWQGVTARSFPYRVRQRPGPHNALGVVKLMMPNPHAVYLHDTPARDLFSRTERTFSSGCIRLAQPLDLTELVLRNQPDWDRARIDRVVASGQTATVVLRRQVPVYIVYFTAFAGSDGAVRYRRDVYDRDQRIINALAIN